MVPTTHGVLWGLGVGNKFMSASWTMEQILSLSKLSVMSTTGQQMHAESGPLSTLENRGMEESEGLMLKVRLESHAGAVEPQGTRRCACTKAQRPVNCTKWLTSSWSLSLIPPDVRPAVCDPAKGRALPAGVGW